MENGSKNALLTEIRGSAIDFDNHFYEPHDCYTNYIDPKYRDHAFEVKGPPGGKEWILGGRTSTYIPPGIVTEVHGRPGLFQGILSGGTDNVVADLASVLVDGLVRIEEHPEWLNRDARLKLMDAQGLQAAVIMPSLGVANYFDWEDMPEILNANVRAFNRWMEDAWGYGADGRIFSVPILTLLDLDWAIEELERVVALGSRFFWLSHGPVNGKSHAHPYFDPFWARVQEMGVKPVYHIANEGFTHHYGTHWGETPCYVIGYSAFQHYLCFGERPISDAIAALILHNLFGRFPGIELISVENGSAWVGPLLRSMDKAWKMGRNGMNMGGTLPDLPSQIFRNHVYVNPFHEENVVELIESIGAERVLFGSDYPHPEGLAEPLDYAEGLVDKVGASDFRKIMRENAASLLGM